MTESSKKTLPKITKTDKMRQNVQSQATPELSNNPSSPSKNRAQKFFKDKRFLAVVTGIGIGLIVWYLYAFPKAPEPIEVCPPTPKTSENGAAGRENSKVIFYIDCLSSGDRTTYERKAVIGAEFPPGERKEYLAWGDEVIPIFGRIASIQSSSANLADKIVMINSTQNEELIFMQFVTTNTLGLFSSKFFAPEDGTIQVIATLIDQNSSADEAVVSVIATQSWMPLILILILVIISVSSIVSFWLYYKTTSSKNKESILKISVIPTIVPIVLAYFILYKFPPFDQAGNAAIGTVLIAPIIAYIIELLKK